jgi:hypothetical protein
VSGRRLLTAEGGNVVIYEVATAARRLLMRTSSAETNPRWARNGSAVTFVRDGNLFLLSLDGSSEGPAEVQLTDVTAPGGAAPAAGPPDATLERAISETRSGEMLGVLGTLEARLGRLEAAEQTLRRVLAPVMVELVNVYFRLRKTEEALRLRVEIDAIRQP